MHKETDFKTFGNQPSMDLDFATNKSSSRNRTGILLKSVPLISTTGTHGPLLEAKEAAKEDRSNAAELSILNLRLNQWQNDCLRGFEAVYTTCLFTTGVKFYFASVQKGWEKTTDIDKRPCAEENSSKEKISREKKGGGENV